MYKVFVKEYPIILTDSKLNLNGLIIIPFEFFEIEKLILFLNQDLISGICLYHADLEWMWSKFQSCFKVIEAAGGLVKNEKNEVLMIYRFNKWDLPKGKIENEETPEIAAIREVKEECGLKKLEIIKPLSTTYHIYLDDKKRNILKTSYWYEMKSHSSEKLFPQKEEGIKRVLYVSKNKLDKLLHNSYANIKILFDEV